MYKYIDVCIYTYMYMICMYLHMCEYIYVHVSKYIYIKKGIFRYICINIHAYFNKYICI